MIIMIVSRPCDDDKLIINYKNTHKHNKPDAHVDSMLLEFPSYCISHV